MCSVRMSMKTKQKLILFILILSIFNIFVSYSITQQKNFNDSADLDSCFAGDTGCYNVQESEYASLFGISLATYGIFSFIGLSILLWILLLIMTYGEKTRLSRYEPKVRLLLSLGILGGALSSVYLIYLQALVIGSFCRYCLVIDFTMLLIAVLYFWIIK